MLKLKRDEMAKIEKKSRKKLESIIRGIHKFPGCGVDYAFVIQALDHIKKYGSYSACGVTVKEVSDICEYDYHCSDDAEVLETLNDYNVVKKNGLDLVIRTEIITDYVISGNSTVFDVLTSQEAAYELGISESTIRKAITSGRLHLGTDYRKAGRITLVNRKSLNKILVKDREETNSISDWNKKLNIIFPDGIPEKHTWTKIDDIINALNIISDPNLNYTFLPWHGGFQLIGAQYSFEKGCIKLVIDNKSGYIIKPAALHFNTFSYDTNNIWSYFRLETKELEPSGIYENYNYSECPFESLTCIDNKKYMDRIYWDKGFYDGDAVNGKKITEKDSIITRIFNGTFVIFAKGSPYNKSAFGANDGRHSRMSAEEFRQYIESAAYRNR